MFRLKFPVFGLVAATAALSLWDPSQADAAERAFVQVEVSDIERSEAWYRKAFGVRRVNRFNRSAFDQRIMIGPDMVVELVQSRPPGPAASGKMLGLSKAGVEVADLDARLAVWRKAGLAPEGGLFFDEALGLATVLLRDPDGAIIQIFGKSAGPFQAVVRVSPDFTPAPGD